MIQTKHLLDIVRGTIYIHFDKYFFVVERSRSWGRDGSNKSYERGNFFILLQPKGVQEEALRVTQCLPLAWAVNKAKVLRVQLKAPWMPSNSIATWPMISAASAQDKVIIKFHFGLLPGSPSVQIPVSNADNMMTLCCLRCLSGHPVDYI